MAFPGPLACQTSNCTYTIGSPGPPLNSPCRSCNFSVSIIESILHNFFLSPFFFLFPSPPCSSLFQYPSTYFYLFSESTQTSSYLSPSYASRKILSLLALSPAWQLLSTHATTTEACTPESPGSAKKRSHCGGKSAHHN